MINGVNKGREVYCVMCHEVHRHYAWRYKKWNNNVGITEGWACGKHFNDMGSIREWTPESVKELRKEYAKSTIQPFRDGQLTKEFKEHYPQQTKQYLKDGKITQREFDKPKAHWKDTYKGDLSKTK